MDSQATMKEIVLGYPACARVLDSLRVNYCCDGGGRTGLEQACQAAGQDAQMVLSRLQQAQSRVDHPDWEGGSASALVRHILDTHHVFTRESLAHMDIVLERLARRHGEARPELHEIRSIFLALRDDLIPHLMKEENILFPYLEALETHTLEGTPLPAACFGVIDNPIRQMESEHEAVTGLLQQIRLITQGYAIPADTCTSYRIALQALEKLESDLLRHIQLENEVLFPQALALAQTL